MQTSFHSHPNHRNAHTGFTHKGKDAPSPNPPSADDLTYLFGTPQQRLGSS